MTSKRLKQISNFAKQFLMLNCWKLKEILDFHFFEFLKRRNLQNLSYELFHENK